MAPPRSARLCPQLPEALQIRYTLIEHPLQLPRLPDAIRGAFDERSVRVTLLGAPGVDVWVVDGDGSALIRLGVLPAIGDAAPPHPGGG